MKVFAKCHGPKVDSLTDGKLYEVISDDGTNFHFFDDDDAPACFRWRGDSAASRWERIEQDDAPESVLTECRHLTEAKWEDSENMNVVRIEVDADREVTVRAGNGEAMYLDARLLHAINETVARHDAVNGGA